MTIFRRILFMRKWLQEVGFSTLMSCDSKMKKRKKIWSGHFPLRVKALLLRLRRFSFFCALMLPSSNVGGSLRQDTWPVRLQAFPSASRGGLWKFRQTCLLLLSIPKIRSDHLSHTPASTCIVVFGNQRQFWDDLSCDLDIQPSVQRSFLWWTRFQWLLCQLLFCASIHGGPCSFCGPVCL